MDSLHSLTSLDNQTVRGRHALKAWVHRISAQKALSEHSRVAAAHKLSAFVRAAIAAASTSTEGVGAQFFGVHSGACGATGGFAAVSENFKCAKKFRMGNSILSHAIVKNSS